jgi:hypothetical protein
MRELSGRRPPSARTVVSSLVAALGILFATALPAAAVWEILYVSQTGPCTSVHTSGDGVAKPRLYSQTSVEWSGTNDSRVNTNVAGNDWDAAWPGYKADCGGGEAWARSYKIEIKQIVHIKAPNARCAGDLGVLVPSGFTTDKGRSSCGDVFAHKITTCVARSGVNVDECRGWIGSQQWVAAGTITRFSRQLVGRFWARDTKSPSFTFSSSDCWASKNGDRGCY